MKTRIAVLWFSICGIAKLVGADVPTPEPRLLGIVSLPDKNLAILQLRNSPFHQFFVLSAGYHFDDFLVQEIKPTTGEVTVRAPGKNAPLRLKLPPVPGMRAPTLHLRAVPADTLPELYQELSGRTVLRGPGLPAATLNIVSEPGLSRDQAVAVLTNTLGTNSVLVRPVGELFAFAIPHARQDLLSSIPPPPPASTATPRPSGQEIPVNMLRFQQADILQLAELYEELAVRTVLHGGDFGRTRITVRNRTVLTRAEGVWLVSALIHLHEVAIIPEGEKLAVMAPFSRTNGLPHLSEKPALRDDDQVSGEKLRLASASREQFLKLYCELAQKSAGSVTRSAAPVRINFRWTGALNRREALFALEALAALKNLAFVMNAEDKVDLVPLNEARKRGRVIP